MVKWAFECDEVSLLFPFKLPSFHTLSREKKNTLTNFQKQTVADNDKLQPTRDNAKSANSNSKTNATFGNGRREEKSKKGTSFLLFGCAIEEKSE